VLTNWKPCDRTWKQRQQAPEPSLPYSQALQIRGANASMGEAIVRAVAVVEQRVDRRARKAVSDRRERAFGATHDEEVIVNERYGQGARLPRV